MRIRTIALFSAAVLGGAIGGSLVGPRPAEAVAREILDLQHDVTTLLQGQKDLSSQMIQDHTVMKTLVEQSADSVGKLSGTMAGLQKAVQDVQANSGARLDTMTTQVQGLSDNLEEIKNRLGKLDQKIADLQNTVQSVDAKISASVPPPTSTTSNPGVNPGAVGQSAGGVPPVNAAPAGGAAAPPPSEMLYSNAYRDWTSGQYDLSRQEFSDYLKYYSDTDLASNAQFYLGEISYTQKKYDEALADYDRVITNYPKSFKLTSAHYKKAVTLIQLGQKPAAIRELRDVIKRDPGSEEARQAHAKLRDLGVPAA
jgi:tol-pal system protein YbgF